MPVERSRPSTGLKNACSRSTGRRTSISWSAAPLGVATAAATATDGGGRGQTSVNCTSRLEP